jgi:hypothetical protein
MLFVQKIWGIVKSKYFIFNAVTIIICLLTAIAIPKIFGNVNFSADTEERETENDLPIADGVGEADPKKPLAEVFGEAVKQTDPKTRIQQTLKLSAKLIEPIEYQQFWEIAVLDENDIVVKSWAEIYAEYVIDPAVIQIGDGFEITTGGLMRATDTIGAYDETVTYSGLSVQISKTATVFR